MELAMTGALMGVAGTVAMDLWALLLSRAGIVPFPDWAGPGRWLGHVARGRVFHDDIKTARAVAGEQALGWGLHYGVGLLYGVVFVLIAGRGWLAEPTLLPVWVFSILTIAAGWFLLQPGMGQGVAAARTPRPWKARGLGLAAHTVFALGMWAAAITLW